MRKIVQLCAIAVVGIFLLCVCSEAQDSDSVYTTPNQQVQAPVGSAVAESSGDSDVLAASVASVFGDKSICCGKGSALEDAVASADAGSLRKVGEKLSGKHYLPNGSAITIVDDYWSGSSVRAEDILASLMAQHPLIIDWDGHLYVLYGAVFDLNKHQSGMEERVIRSLLLVDTRYSGAKRYVTFDRQKDDFGKVDGVLSLSVRRGS